MTEALKEAVVTERTTSDSPTRELAYRANDGVEVALLWHPIEDRLTVSVADERAGDQFELAVDSEDALDAFNHPYAYAAFRGIGYRGGARRVGEATYA
jgi:hypothetical protein